MHTTRFYILSSLAAFALAFFICMPLTAKEEKKFTLVIDAGHGGHDPGAIGNNVREKNINLKVALKLGNLLQKHSDINVVYTRKTDVFIPLHRRAEIANNAKADLFISIHTNSLASRKKQVNGAETYTLGLHRTQENLEVAQKENSVILIEDDYKQQYAGFNPNSAESYIIFEFLQDKYMEQSVSLAQKIQQQFQSSGRTNKGVHQAGFLVLRETSMPSVLIELGYITNPSEAAFLISDKGSSTMANSIYKAVISYRNRQTHVQSAGTIPANIPENSATNEETETSGKKGTAIEKLASSSTSSASNNTRPRHTSNQEVSKPVFKIQILTASKILPKGSKQLKGLSPVSYYKENGVIKYTYGEDTDYNAILRLKKNKVNAKFKDCFIIAFKNGKKMDVNEAIREFKRNKQK